jgi:lysophospholipase L1-like esterase
MLLRRNRNVMPASYRTVACGGAKTGDVRTWQVPHLSSRTDLVTITIGGNDAGFARWPPPWTDERMGPAIARRPHAVSRAAR